MAIELRLRRHDRLMNSDEPFFASDTAPTASLVIPLDRWERLGRPEELLVVIEDIRLDSRTTTAEIPVITGESEVIIEERRPVPGIRETQVRDVVSPEAKFVEKHARGPLFPEGAPRPVPHAR